MLCSIQFVSGQNFHDSIPQKNDTLYIYINFLNRIGIYKATYKSSDSILHHINDSLQHKGYLFNRLIPDSIKTQNKQLYLYYHTQLNRQRRIDSVVITGTKKFPKNIIKKINKIHQNNIIDTINLQKLKIKLKCLTPYQIDDPVINFKNGQNMIVINAKEQNFNSFGGFLGLVYKQKINLEGYLDIKLYNLFNANETFNLKWQKKDNYQNLNWSFKYPFIHGSNISFSNLLFMSQNNISDITFINETLLNLQLNKHTVGLNILYDFESLKKRNETYFGINYLFSISKDKQPVRFIKSNLKINVKNKNQWLAFIKLRYDIKVSGFIYYTPKIQWLINPEENGIPYQQIQPDIFRKYITDDTNYRQVFSFKNELKYTSKNTSFYLIGDFIHKKKSQNQLASYINTGLGLKIFNKKQILTFEIIKPVLISYITDYQLVYINIKQVIRF